MGLFKADIFTCLVRGLSNSERKNKKGRQQEIKNAKQILDEHREHEELFQQFDLINLTDEQETSAVQNTDFWEELFKNNNADVNEWKNEINETLPIINCKKNYTEEDEIKICKEEINERIQQVINDEMNGNTDEKNQKATNNATKNDVSRLTTIKKKVFKWCNMKKLSWIAKSSIKYSFNKNARYNAEAMSNDLKIKYKEAIDDDHEKFAVASTINRNEGNVQFKRVCKEMNEMKVAEILLKVETKNETKIKTTKMIEEKHQLINATSAEEKFEYNGTIYGERKNIATTKEKDMIKKLTEVFNDQTAKKFNTKINMKSNFKINKIKMWLSIIVQYLVRVSTRWK